MQLLQDHFFYSNSRLGSDGGLERERQVLAEQQKLCQSRARKFSLETNRRRKALDERRKQWDVQEERLRERILQQRRQQVQDATERFQRAHLPPSQRRRQPFRRNVVTLEDALSQIQGALNSYSQQSSFPSNNGHISRSCTPSPKPPTVSKSSHRQVISAIEAYTKLLEDQNRTDKQQDYSPQVSHPADYCSSESLLSKDSLENEDPDHSPQQLQSSYSSPLLGINKPQSDVCGTSDLTSVSAMVLLDNVDQSGKLHEAKQKNEASEWTDCKMHFSKGLHGFTSLERALKTEARETNNRDSEHFEVDSQQNSPSDNTVVTNRDALGNAALVSSYSKQEAHKQEWIHDDRQLKYQALESLPPAKNGNGKDFVFQDPLKPNIFLDAITTDNLSKEEFLQQRRTDNCYLSLEKEHSASINNLNKESNSEPKTEKPINTESLQHTSLSNIQSDVQKCPDYPEEELQKLVTAQSVCEVRFVKGILKKQSKYISGEGTCVFGSGHLIFAQQVALAIRDSVELTWRKTKGMEASRAVRKKLRWFDEVHMENEAKEQNRMKQTKGKCSTVSRPKISPADHHLSLSAGSGTPKNGPSVTPVPSTGYHFTKEAWADVGVQVNLPQDRADEVKMLRASTRTGGPKALRRDRSARIGGGPVSSRTRKGAVMRPQSATEVSQIARTQGRIIVPHPPPRTETAEEKTLCVTKAPYGGDHTSVNTKQALAAEQRVHKNHPESGTLVITSDNTITCTPLPPSYTRPIPEGNMLSTPSSGHQDTCSYRRRRGMTCSERGFCLDCTPTDEEISQLWHGVRCALTTKEGKTSVRGQAPESGRVLRKVDAEQSRQPPGSGNRKVLQTSQLIPAKLKDAECDVAAFILTHLSVCLSVRLSTFPGNRYSSEAPVATKLTHNDPQPRQTELLRPFLGSNNTASHIEGLESAAQLHLAKVHAEGLLEERHIVAAMETAQTQRPAAAQQPNQQQGLTNISLEEKRILLSLDRLNHQLRCEHFLDSGEITLGLSCRLNHCDVCKAEL
ncbi:centrosomal protein of 126 kDa [Pholidichthys leucotaenia]